MIYLKSGYVMIFYEKPNNFIGKFIIGIMRNDRS